MAMLNGDLSEADDIRSKPSPTRSRSESELSDVHELPTASIPSLPAQNYQSPSDNDAIHDMATSELDEDEDAPGEDDVNYGEDGSPQQDPDRSLLDQSSSDESSQPRKRKAEIDDEEYIKQNPELYGLRRSVSIFPPGRNFSLADRPTQGRARPSRRIV